ncbi:MAG: hypothetical protein RLZZ598_1185 [Pseudomonadota bacterium]|jgi:hypothetical protein
MTLHRPVLAFALILGACLGTAQAQVQWKWKDAKGQIQYSDRPPPAGTPDKDVLQRPTLTVTRAQPLPPASAPTGIDPALETRKKKADQEKVDAEALARKAEGEKQAKLKAENCQSATSYLRSLQEGQRIARTNEKGERSYIDDAERAREAERARQTISTDCR